MPDGTILAGRCKSANVSRMSSQPRSWERRFRAAYGHFGREHAGFPWEETDMADKAKDFLSA